MSIFQIGAICFALVMMYLVRINKRRAGLSNLETTFWLSIWFIFGFIAVFPNTLLGLTDFLHFQRVFDVLVVAGMMILTFVTITNYFSNKITITSLEKVVRQLAHSATREEKLHNETTKK